MGGFILKESQGLVGFHPVADLHGQRDDLSGHRGLNHGLSLGGSRRLENQVFYELFQLDFLCLYIDRSRFRCLKSRAEKESQSNN